MFKQVCLNVVPRQAWGVCHGLRHINAHPAVNIYIYIYIYMHIYVCVCVSAYVCVVACVCVCMYVCVCVVCVRDMIWNDTYWFFQYNLGNNYHVWIWTYFCFWTKHFLRNVITKQRLARLTPGHATLTAINYELLGWSEGDYRCVIQAARINCSAF